MRTVLVWAFAALLAAQAASAQRPASEFVTETVYDSPNGITALEFDHQGRLLLAEKQGRIVMLQPDGAGGFAPPAAVFATLQNVRSVSESGLLGMALDPAYANNRYIYLCYTWRDGEMREQRVTRIRANASFTAMEPGSEHVILGDLPFQVGNHKAGDLHFSPASPTELYVATGDDNQPDATQLVDRYEGKLLRIDSVTGLAPADNPFFDGNPASTRSRVWARGFRNPFRFSFHPVLASRAVVYSSENGAAIDKLSHVRIGSNGYWSSLPGGGPDYLAPPDPGHRVLATDWASFVGIAISPGGPFGTDVVYLGKVNGSIRRYQLVGVELDSVSPAAGEVFLSAGQSTIDMSFGPDGALYGTIAGDGASTGGSFPVRRIRHVAGSAPVAAFKMAPDPPHGDAPLTVQFRDVSASGDGAIVQRQWDFGDGATAAGTQVEHVYGTPGDYSARLTVTNAAGQGDSTARIVRVTRHVAARLRGRIWNADTSPATPPVFATTLALFEADGETPLPFKGGAGASRNELTVAAGGQIDRTVLLQPSTESLVVAAGASDRRIRAGAWLPTGDGPHEIVLNFYLAGTMIEGRVSDTRGAPVATDIGAFRGDQPYALAQGRDSLVAPLGTPHRVESDASGWFHMPLRSGDASDAFVLDVVGDTLAEVFATQRVNLEVAAGAVHRVSLVLGRWHGGRDCTDLPGPGAPNDIDYVRDIQPVWNEYCTGCHNATATNSGSLDLTAPVSLAQTVNALSSLAPGVLRIEPGRPERSFLLEKINCADPQSGNRMRPTGAIPLEAQRLVRDWVASMTQIFAGGFEAPSP